VVNPKSFKAIVNRTESHYDCFFSDQKPDERTEGIHSPTSLMVTLYKAIVNVLRVPDAPTLGRLRHMEASPTHNVVTDAVNA